MNYSEIKDLHLKEQVAAVITASGYKVPSFMAAMTIAKSMAKLIQKEKKIEDLAFIVHETEDVTLIVDICKYDENFNRFLGNDFSQELKDLSKLLIKEEVPFKLVKLSDFFQTSEVPAQDPRAELIKMLEELEKSLSAKFVMNMDEIPANLSMTDVENLRKALMEMVKNQDQTVRVDRKTGHIQAIKVGETVCDDEQCSCRNSGEKMPNEEPKMHVWNPTKLIDAVYEETGIPVNAHHEFGFGDQYAITEVVANKMRIQLLIDKNYKIVKKTIL